MGAVTINTITHTRSDNEATKLRSAKAVFDYLDKSNTANINELNSIYNELYKRYIELRNRYTLLSNNYYVLYSAYTKALNRKNAATAQEVNKKVGYNANK